MIYGKLDPVHLGHYKMFINGSCCTDKDTDFVLHVTANTLIPYEVKCNMITDYYPFMKAYLCKEPVSTIFEAIQNASANYENLVLLCGSDRKDEFQKILDDYTGRFWNFKSALACSVGERDANNLSSTNLRNAITSDNFEEFCTFMPDYTIGTMFPENCGNLNVKYFNELKEYL